MKWFDGLTDLMDMSLSRHQELVIVREACMLQSMGSQRVGHNSVTELSINDVVFLILNSSFLFRRAIDIC